MVCSGLRVCSAAAVISVWCAWVCMTLCQPSSRLRAPTTRSAGICGMWNCDRMRGLMINCKLETAVEGTRRQRPIQQVISLQDGVLCFIRGYLAVLMIASLSSTARSNLSDVTE